MTVSRKKKFRQKSRICRHIKYRERELQKRRCSVFCAKRKIFHTERNLRFALRPPLLVALMFVFKYYQRKWLIQRYSYWQWWARQQISLVRHSSFASDSLPSSVRQRQSAIVSPPSPVCHYFRPSQSVSRQSVTPVSLF